MHVLSFIVMVLGLAAWLLSATGFGPLVPVVDDLSALVWLGVAFVGGVVFMWTRRPGD